MAPGRPLSRLPSWAYGNPEPSAHPGIPGAYGSPMTRSPRLRRPAILAALLIAAAPPCGAQTKGEIPKREPAVTKKDLIWLGASTVASIGIMQLDTRIALGAQDSSLQRNGGLQNAYKAFNLLNEKSLFAASVLTWLGARVVHARSTSDIAFHSAEAVFVSGAVGTIARGVLGRSRPFVTADRDAFDYHNGKGFSELKYRSFPSIHSSAAFATAAVVVSEMRVRGAKHQRVIAPLLYTLAAGPGLARIYGDKHWTSDVAMGAALGVVSGIRTVHYAHGHPGNRVDRFFLGHATASTGPQGPVLAMGWTF